MLHEHLGYLSDPVRLDRFREAIGMVVRPGDRVADVGCGSGVLGLLSLQAGAAHVYGIDDSAMIDVARESMARAGLADRATFLRGRSQQIELPERVDVVVCDHVGHFGLDYDIVRLLRDANRRFLKPEGALIPARIHLQIAAVESERCRQLAEGWADDAVPAEFRWLRNHAVNTKHDVSLEPEEVLGLPVELGAIDFRGDDREFFSWTAEIRMERDGALHGLGGWFDCELCTGVRMTNSPLAKMPIRRWQVFLPVAEPSAVHAGEMVSVTVMARPADDLFAWTVEFPATGRRFSHSTWQGMLLSPQDLLHANSSRVPVPTHEGSARGIVLGYCDGRRTAREIERAIAVDHPSLFPTPEEIARFVASVLAKETK